MPPKGRTLQEKNFAQTVAAELTSADNRQVLTAVGLFVAGVAFLHSSFSEFLLPP